MSVGDGEADARSGEEVGEREDARGPTGVDGVGGVGGVGEIEPDPRFSYANERTFLAWIRTALGLITAGLAVTQLFPDFGVPGGRRMIGLPLIALGVLIALLSYSNWQRNEQAMRWQRPLPRTFLPRLVAVVVSAVAVIGLVLVLVEGGGR